YKNAYNLYLDGDYQQARSIIRSTLDQFPLTKNTERLQLLDIMISGKIDDRQIYQERLEAYVQNTEDHGLLKLARNLLTGLTGEQMGEGMDPVTPIDLPDSTAIF